MTKLYKQFHDKSCWPPVHTPNRQLHEPPEYAGQDIIKLQYESMPDRNISELISNRNSTKALEQRASLNKRELGTFLKSSAGRKDSDPLKRTYPSAGSLYPNRILVEVRQIDDLPVGLYEYLPEQHSLAKINNRSGVDRAFVQSDIEFNFCLIVAGNFDYACSAYGERGYRFCLMEAGHMVQNMLLISNALSWDTAPVGGFEDDFINSSILPDQELSALYLVPIGKAK